MSNKTTSFPIRLTIGNNVDYSNIDERLAGELFFRSERQKKPLTPQDYLACCIETADPQENQLSRAKVVIEKLNREKEEEQRALLKRKAKISF